ncbi:MAG TPA: SGNH hydrolase domain-containing protein, partial [Hyphomicrobiales bacterium]|nr:SGNH hydrolase domain-containing protein [Hyphomicrobiales bacterium]
GLVIIAAILAAFSWRFVEKPFRKRPAANMANAARSRIPMSAYAALSLTAIMAACGFYFGALAPTAGKSAGAKVSQATVEGCLDQIRVKKGPVECVFGRGRGAGNTEVILWGDSHAMAYALVLSSLYDSGRAYMLLDCVPVLGATAVAGDGRPVKKNCDSANEYSIAEIERLKPKLVILAARWTVFQGVPYGHESRTPRYLVTNRKEPRTIEHSQRVLGEKLPDTIARINRLGARVVLIGPAPEMKLPVEKCLALSASLSLDDSKCRSIGREEVERRQAVTKQILLEAAAKTGASIFWPSEQLCDERRCYALRNGEVLYNDGDHLTAIGSMSLAPALAATLKLARPEDIAFRNIGFAGSIPR